MRGESSISDPSPTEGGGECARRWRGYFIAIEGIDGTGKTTLACALAAALEARGVRAVVSGEPTEGPHGRRIRELAAQGREGVSAEEEVDLFLADRKAHVAEVILPNLRAGRVVILDRYFYSSIAYQGARGADAEEVARRNRAVAPEPDLLVILRLEVNEALERIRRSRAGPPDHFERARALRKVQALFDAARHPNLLALDARLATGRLVDEVLRRMPPSLVSRGA